MLKPISQGSKVSINPGVITKLWRFRSHHGLLWHAFGARLHHPDVKLSNEESSVLSWYENGVYKNGNAAARAIEHRDKFIQNTRVNTLATLHCSLRLVSDKDIRALKHYKFILLMLTLLILTWIVNREKFIFNFKCLITYENLLNNIVNLKFQMRLSMRDIDWKCRYILKLCWLLAPNSLKL